MSCDDCDSQLSQCSRVKESLDAVHEAVSCCSLSWSTAHEETNVRDADAWLFCAGPAELRLHHRLMLRTRVGARLFLGFPLRACCVILACLALYLALNFLRFFSCVAAVCHDHDGMRRGTRTTLPYALGVTVLSTTSNFVALHFANQDLFLRQICSFESVTIILHSTALCLCQMVSTLACYGERYDAEWVLADLVCVVATVPVYTVLAALDSIRLRNAWKVVILLSVCGLLSLEYLRFTFSGSTAGERQCAEAGFEHEQVQRGYAGAISTLIAFFLKAASTYFWDAPFAVVRPSFYAVPLDGRQWSSTRKKSTASLPDGDPRLPRREGDAEGDGWNANTMCHRPSKSSCSPRPCVSPSRRPGYNSPTFTFRPSSSSGRGSPRPDPSSRSSSLSFRFTGCVPDSPAQTSGDGAAEDDLARAWQTARARCAVSGSSSSHFLQVRATTGEFGRSASGTTGAEQAASAGVAVPRDPGRGEHAVARDSPRDKSGPPTPTEHCAPADVSVDAAAPAGERAMTSGLADVSRMQSFGEEAAIHRPCVCKSARVRNYHNIASMPTESWTQCRSQHPAAVVAAAQRWARYPAPPGARTPCFSDAVGELAGVMPPCADQHAGVDTTLVDVTSAIEHPRPASLGVLQRLIRCGLPCGGEHDDLGTTVFTESQSIPAMPPASAESWRAVASCWKPDRGGHTRVGAAAAKYTLDVGTNGCEGRAAADHAEHCFGDVGDEDFGRAGVSV